MSIDPTPPERPRPRLVLPITLGLAVLILGGILAYRLFDRGSTPPHRPGATMVFLADRATPSLLPGSRAIDRDEFETYRQSEAAIVRSRHTLNTALNAPGIRDNALIREAKPDPLTWLADNLRVTLSPSPSGMMVVELDGENPEVLQVLDAIGKAYLAASSERTNGGRLRRQADLEKMIAQCQSELKRNNDRIQEISAVLGYSQKSETLLVDDQFAAREFEKIIDELRRVRLDRALYLSNRPAPLHQGAEPAPIAVAGGAPAALSQRLTAMPDGLDTPEGKAFAARERFWQAELARIATGMKKAALYSTELNNFTRTIRAREADLERYEAALRVMKDEFWSPPRIIVIDEPYIRPGK
jgi:hypothetical protein